MGFVEFRAEYDWDHEVWLALCSTQFPRTNFPAVLNFDVPEALEARPSLSKLLPIDLYAKGHNFMLFHSPA
jgi:hypothetical protein